jgi:tripeptidyl-peptidase-1
VLIRTTHYSLPEHLHEHIELVQPTTYFGRPKPMSSNLLINVLGFPIHIFPSPPPSAPGTLMDPRLGVNCTDVTTVWCLQHLYNTAGYKPVATDKNKIGITGYLGQFANMADLQSFYNAERPDAVNSSFQTVLVNGAYACDGLDICSWKSV